MSSLVAGRRAADGSYVDVIRYAAGQYLAPHAHGFTAVSMVLHGRLREDAGAGRVRAGTLDLVVKPRATRHENLFLAPGTTLVQVVPSGETLRRAAEAGCPLERWRWADGAPAARVLVRLAAALVEGHADVDLGNAVADALAALDDTVHPRPAGRPPAWLQRVRKALDDAVERVVEPPSISGLATEEGVHRVHLSREFRRWYGVPPTEYRVRERLRRATERVGTSDESLSAAAYRTGYADQAHMTREFSDRLGVTPRQFRRLLPAYAPA